MRVAAWVGATGLRGNPVARLLSDGIASPLMAAAPPWFAMTNGLKSRRLNVGWMTMRMNEQKERRHTEPVEVYAGKGLYAPASTGQKTYEVFETS